MKTGKKILIFFIWLLIISGCGLANEKNMVKAIEAIPGEENYILLYNDGTVWEGTYGEGEELLEQIEELEDVVKIVNMGKTFYALTEAGEVYGWGSNRNYEISWPEELGDNSVEEYYSMPQKMEALENIVDIDARNGAAFALDKENNLCMWGLFVYADSIKDFIPGFPKEKKPLIGEVAYISAGAGFYHYFMRADGSVFSILHESIFDSGNLNFRGTPDFIYPVFFREGRKAENIRVEDIKQEELSQGTKLSKIVLYELQNQEKIKLIGADAYTVFVYKGDNTLWYWDSEMLTYQYIRRNPDTGLSDYSGIFVQVDIEEILREEAPKITDICAGKEYTLFLSENGQVFMNEYLDSNQQEDYGYNPHFTALPWENIVSINTDGKNQFMAVDKEGNYYYFNPKLTNTTINYNRRIP